MYRYLSNDEKIVVPLICGLAFILLFSTLLLNNIQNKNGCCTTFFMQHDSHCVLKFGRYFSICSIQQVCSLLFLS